MKWSYWEQVVFIMFSTNLKKKKLLHNKMQAALTFYFNLLAPEFYI